MEKRESIAKRSAINCPGVPLNRILQVVTMLSVALTALVATNVSAATFAHIDGTESVAIGQGLNHRMNDVRVEVLYRDNVPNSIRIDSGAWHLEFGAPYNRPELVPDNYEFASRLSSRNTFPNIFISRLSTSCNNIIGRFVVREFETNAQQQATVLALDFSAECFDLNGGEILSGEIRFQSDIAEIPQGPTAAAGLDRSYDENSIVKIDGRLSMPGASAIRAYEWSQLSGPTVSFWQTDVGSTAVLLPDVSPGGQPVRLQLAVTNAGGFADTDIVELDIRDVADRRSGLYLTELQDFLPMGSESFRTDDLGEFTVTSLENENVKRIEIRYEGIDTINMEFYVPFDGALEPGFYANAQRAPFHSRRKPAQRIAQQCVYLIAGGWFNIRELTFDTNGNVDALAVDFMESCVNLVAQPVFKGALRFNSNVPLVADGPSAAAGQDRRTYSGETVVLNGLFSAAPTAILRSGGEELVSYRWTQLGGVPVTLLSPNNGVASFIAPLVQKAETIEFELTVIDDLGESDSDRIAVTVLPVNANRNTMIVRGGPEHYVLFGTTQVFDDESGEFEFTTGVIQRLFTGVRADESWLLDLHTTDGSPLMPGSYSGNVISFSGSGRSCGADLGSFDLARYEQDGSGNVTALDVDFEHVCGLTNNGQNAATGLLAYNVSLPGIPPVADAGPDRRVAEGAVFTLDGNGSSDADGEIVRYTWTQLAGRDHQLASAPINRRNVTIPDIVALPFKPGASEEVLVFELTVDDDLGFSSSDTMTVTVERATVVPVAADDSYTIGHNTILNAAVLQNDIAGSGTINNISILQQPFFGEISFPGNDIVRFTPDTGFIGDDYFVYTILDDAGNFSEPALVLVTVNAAAPPPTPTPPPPPPPSPNPGNSGGGGGSISPFALMSLALLAAGFSRRRWSSREGASVCERQ